MTNFDKLFEDDKLRRRAKSCFRTEKIFDRAPDQQPLVAVVPNPGLTLQPLLTKHQPQCSSYRVVQRSCPATFLEKLTRKPRKSMKEEAEEVREEILQVCCDPLRPLPGSSSPCTPALRLETGVDCDEVRKFPIFLVYIYLSILTVFTSLR